MTSFTFTPEQIKSAPPEVRLWIEQEIAAAFRALASPAPSPAQTPELAACTPEEALRLFEMIRDDFGAAQLFLELGREPPIGASAALHALSIGEIKRHLRLGDDRLADCFREINRSFARVRNDPGAALFGFDQTNHVYIHEITHQSIRRLWEELARLRAPATAAAAGETSPAPFAFRAPVVGPSEDITAH